MIFIWSINSCVKVHKIKYLAYLDTDLRDKTHLKFIFFYNGRILDSKPYWYKREHQRYFVGVWFLQQNWKIFTLFHFLYIYLKLLCPSFDLMLKHR